MIGVPTPCPKSDVLRRQLALVDAGARFFSDLFEHAPEAMIVVDTAGNILLANTAVCRLYAVDRSELVRLNVHDLLPANLDRKGAVQHLRDYGEVSLEFSETANDGTETEMRLEARLFHADRYLLSFRDVTREKRFERESERAHEHRTFSEAAASVVHDVNNLLIPIFCYTDLLALRGSADGELHQSVAEIRHAAERAACLARKLLSVAELTSEERGTIDLNLVVDRMADMLTRLLGGDIALSVRLDPELGKISVDGDRLERMILNLVLNARDAMPRGGKVILGTASVLREAPHSEKVRGAPRRYASLSITDTGIGMDAMTRQRIFEPFFTTKSRGHGTGLGLSSALSFVHRSQGYIEVDTEPGRGTTFRIGLPEVAGPSSSV
jgi:two-component system, cell cycle sensor histidine kinase and response regulator CckA